MKYYLKIQENTVVEAPNIIVKNGYTIYGYNDENNETMLLQDGYSIYPKNAYAYEVKDGKIVQKQPQPIVEETVFTKLQIRHACRALELEQKLDDLISSNERFYHQWTDAQEIDLNDPLISQAIEAGVFTQEEFNQIKDFLTK